MSKHLNFSAIAAEKVATAEEALRACGQLFAGKRGTQPPSRLRTADTLMRLPSNGRDFLAESATVDLP